MDRSQETMIHDRLKALDSTKHPGKSDNEINERIVGLRKTPTVHSR